MYTQSEIFVETAILTQRTVKWLIPATLKIQNPHDHNPPSHLKENDKNENLLIKDPHL